MNTVHKDKFPEFLKDSELYRVLSDDDMITVDKNKFVDTIILENNQDLIELLEIFRFWMIDRNPYKVYEFILSSKFDWNSCKDILYDKFNDLKFIIEFELLQIQDVKTLLKECAKHNCLDLMRYIYTNEYEGQKQTAKNWHNETTYEAALHNSFDCLKYAFENKCKIHPKTFEVAASVGNLEVLKYALEVTKRHIKNPRGKTVYLYRWNAHICYEAIKHDHMHILRYAVENGCCLNNTMLGKTIEHDRMEMFKYLLEKKCPSEESMLHYILKNNKLKYLDFLIENKDL